MLPESPGPIWKWDPVYSNPNNGEGYWLNAAGNTMNIGKGYIVRAPSTFTSTPAPLSGSFTGVANNGDINYIVKRGTRTAGPYTGSNGTTYDNLADNLNLVGNPYPSAISANQFINDNASVLRDGIKIWTHGAAPSTSPSQPYYGTYTYNYTPNDYCTWTLSGSPCFGGSDYFVGSGQGFFVTRTDGAADNTATILFRNFQRTGAGYTNSNFSRNSTTNTCHLGVH